MQIQTARKRFGQHFLQDKTVIERLLDIVKPIPGQHFVEIGPGQGALTLPLLQKIKELHVIEIDRDLIPALKERCAALGTLTIHAMDALTFHFADIAKPNQSLRVIGNLPYNISTPLIFHLLTFAQYIQDMHFMLQKEVVDRITAGPNDDAYGRLSVMVQYHCQVKGFFDIPPSAFYPPPRVDSKIIRIVPYSITPYSAKDYDHFSRIVREAFCHRRKTLRNSLKGIMTDTNWKNVEIDSHLRAEQLGVADYVKMSNSLIEN